MRRREFLGVLGGAVAAIPPVPFGLGLSFQEQLADVEVLITRELKVVIPGQQIRARRGGGTFPRSLICSRGHKSCPKPRFYR